MFMDGTSLHTIFSCLVRKHDGETDQGECGAVVVSEVEEKNRPLRRPLSARAAELPVVGKGQFIRNL